ncbi:membrane protein [Devosia soli]|uniref:Membrane protein n=1 Tax=Devosia soli TaxID=361041 RepID=A0A0F5LHQ3_9HYPH|nr:YkvA family protein [Devosia soli]KKB81087.1 membrane protein [Devosia soli]
MTFIERAKTWARAIKRDVLTLWIAARDPRTPWSARILAACVAAYALSPVDLIPDFVPVLGYLDDLLIVPLGIVLVMKLIPDTLLADFRIHAATMAAKPTSRAGLLVILALWLLAALALFAWLNDII